MKNLIFKYLLFILLFTNGYIFAQNAPPSNKGNTVIASKDFMGMTLELMLKEIAREYELELDYNPAQLRKGLMPVKIYRNTTLSKMLNDLLSDTNLQFFLNSQKLVLRPKVVTLRKVKLSSTILEGKQLLKPLFLLHLLT